MSVIEEVLAAHRYPGELLTVLGEAWFNCSCGQRFDVPVRDNKIRAGDVTGLFNAHLAEALAPIIAARESAAVEAFRAKAVAAIEASLPSMRFRPGRPTQTKEAPPGCSRTRQEQNSYHEG